LQQLFFHAAVNSFLKMHKKLHSTAKWNELKFLVVAGVALRGLYREKNIQNF
jgi:hypothetical protein